MHTPVPIMLPNFRRVYQMGPTVFGIDLTMNASSPLHICASRIEDSSFWPSPSRPAVVYTKNSLCFASIPQQDSPHAFFSNRDIAAVLSSQMTFELLHGPRSASATPHHVSLPCLRPTTAGFHSRRRGDFVWSHFSPDLLDSLQWPSETKGAFTVTPLLLCWNQAMLSISSHSANPLRGSREKTP
jgi:hypothetical protein